MKFLERIPFMSAALCLGAGLLAVPQRSMAQTNSDCVQTLASDARAISADVSAIAAQAKAQGFNIAVEQFASDMETILPTLDRPSQESVQKFVTDLESAISPSGPGGTSITAGERLMLTNDWVVLVTETGATSAQLTTISSDLTGVLSALRGISTAQLQSDLNTLVTDAQVCASQH